MYEVYVFILYNCIINQKDMETLIKRKQEIKVEFKNHLKTLTCVKKDLAMKEIQYAIELNRQGVSLSF